MMIIISSQTIHMQRHTRRLRPAHESMRQHLTTQIPNLLPLQSQFYYRKGPI